MTWVAFLVETRACVCIVMDKFVMFVLIYILQGHLGLFGPFLICKDG